MGIVTDPDKLLDLNEVIPGWSTYDFSIPEWKFDGKPALLISHMQEGIVGKGPYGGWMGGAPKEQQQAHLASTDIIPNQKKLLAAFRERNLPIIFAVVSPPTHLGFYPKWGFIWRMMASRAPIESVPADNLNSDPAIQAMVQIIPELERRPNEPLLIHTGAALFTGTNLNDILRHHCVNEVVMTGYTVHSTVYNSVIQLCDHYYSVVVPIDSTGGPDRDAPSPEVVSTKMIQMYGLATTTDDVIAHLPAIS